MTEREKNKEKTKRSQEKKRREERKNKNVWGRLMTGMKGIENER